MSMRLLREHTEPPSLFNKLERFRRQQFERLEQIIERIGLPVPIGLEIHVIEPRDIVYCVYNYARQRNRPLSRSQEMDLLERLWTIGRDRLFEAWLDAHRPAAAFIAELVTCDGLIMATSHVRACVHDYDQTDALFFDCLGRPLEVFLEQRGVPSYRYNGTRSTKLAFGVLKLIGELVRIRRVRPSRLRDLDPNELFDYDPFRLYTVKQNMVTVSLLGHYHVPLAFGFFEIFDGILQHFRRIEELVCQ